MLELTLQMSSSGGFENVHATGTIRTPIIQFEYIKHGHINLIKLVRFIFHTSTP